MDIDEMEESQRDALRAMTVHKHNYLQTLEALNDMSQMLHAMNDIVNMLGEATAAQLKAILEDITRHFPDFVEAELTDVFDQDQIQEATIFSNKDENGTEEDEPEVVVPMFAKSDVEMTRDEGK